MEKSFLEIRQEKTKKAVEMTKAGKTIEDIGSYLKVSYRTVQRMLKAQNESAKSNL